MATAKDIIKPAIKYLGSRKDKALLGQAALNTNKQDRDFISSVFSVWERDEKQGASLVKTINRGETVDAEVKYNLARYYDYSGKAKEIKDPTTATVAYKLRYKGKDHTLTSEHFKNFLMTAPIHEINHLTVERLGLPRQKVIKGKFLQDLKDILETENIQDTSASLHELYASLINNPNAKRLFPEKMQKVAKNLNKKAGGRNIDIVDVNAPPKQMSFMNKLYPPSKVLGAAGVAAGATLLPSEDAEAFPFGKVIKGMKSIKASKGIKSGTSKELTGRVLFGEEVKGLQMEGKTILNVTKSAGPWRNINFDDGTSLPVTKDILHDIMREVGGRNYQYKFSQERGIDKLLAAEKSLKFHLARVNKKKAGYQRKRLEKRLKQTFEPSTVEHVTCYYKGIELSMPREKAELLERVGRVVIERGGK